jgi:hypothetical protein
VVDLLSLSRALEKVNSWRFDEGGPPAQPLHFLPRVAVGRHEVDILLWLTPLEEGEAHAVLGMKGKVWILERGT